MTPLSRPAEEKRRDWKDTMTGDESLQFVEHLRQHNHLTKTVGNGELAEQGGSERSQGKLWELTDLSASEFADEAARFSGLERVTLQDMLSAPPLGASFSQRFLREMMVFPYQSADGSACWRSPIRPIRRRGAPRKSCSGRMSRSRWRQSKISRLSSISVWATTMSNSRGDGERAAAARRRYRKLARSCQRRARGARRQ